MVDAAEATMDTLCHYIWSTLADTERISAGHCTVPHYESKVAVNHYIESKPELFSGQPSCGVLTMRRISHAAA
ncbi:hypothetical protein V495_04026 [Pseudogymnoascus sp. VKM F-4514 (FW-929)]|nr:hypothetical protein V495_04026 [Pseudogymnoascus sp. VKM F-4514 (FW-929)]KFY53978.1 hypothetical protein V497_08074 [Pseudogymnoascus sp. VKM F-4516 (FW-969)]